MGRLNDRDIESGLQGLHGWSRDGDAVTRQFTFDDFPHAIGFLVRLAFVAEAADHHPDITINYKRVTLRYSTHSEGGITQKDLDGARAADDLARRS